MRIDDGKHLLSPIFYVCKLSNDTIGLVHFTGWYRLWASSNGVPIEGMTIRTLNGDVRLDFLLVTPVTKRRKSGIRLTL